MKTKHVQNVLKGIHTTNSVLIVFFSIIMKIKHVQNVLKELHTTKSVLIVFLNY